MRLRMLERTIVALLLMSLMLPVRPAAASEVESVAALDVALSSSGVLEGQVVDAQGISREGVPVIVSRDGQEVAHTTTATEGRFVVTGLAGGLYTIEAEDASIACRAWVANTAPPVAQRGVLLVASETVERGAISGFTGAWLVGLGLAGIITAVVVSDDDSSS